MVKVANTIIARMRLRDLTVAEWARLNRYKPDTVYKTIHGLRGRTGRGESQRIKMHLRHDGFWPGDDEELGFERSAKGKTAG